ncbi:hypothetical protein RCL1_008400 [Eukaryota sp. TZLM3-RCL]
MTISIPSSCLSRSLICVLELEPDTLVALTRFISRFGNVSSCFRETTIRVISYILSNSLVPFAFEFPKHESLLCFLHSIKIPGCFFSVFTCIQNIPLIIPFPVKSLELSYYDDDEFFSPNFITKKIENFLSINNFQNVTKFETVFDHNNFSFDFIPIYLPCLTSLKLTSLDPNNFSESNVVLPFGLSALSFLEISWSGYTLDVSNLVSLKSLICRGNLLDSAKLIGLNFLNELTILQIFHVEISSELNPFTRLELFRAYGLKADSLSFLFNNYDNFENCRIVFISCYSLNFTDWNFQSKMIELAVNDSTFSFRDGPPLFSLKSFSTLESLKITCRSIESLRIELPDVFNLTILQCWYLKFNLLFSLLSRSKFLRKLVIAKTNLPAPISLFSFDYLHELSLIEVKGFFELFSVMPRVKILVLTQVSDFDMSFINKSFPVLKQLYMNDCSLGTGIFESNFSVNELHLRFSLNWNEDIFILLSHFNNLFILDLFVPLNVGVNFFELPSNVRRIRCDVPLGVLKNSVQNLPRLEVLVGSLFCDENFNELELKDFVSSLLSDVFCSLKVVFL